MAESPFLETIIDRYGEETAQCVNEAFTLLGVPLPTPEECGSGTEGWNIYLNDFGMLIRLEAADGAAGRTYDFDRIDNDPDVLQPVLALPAGELTIELCPGLNKALPGDEFALYRSLMSRGIQFWDAYADNVGRVPVHTEEYPDGKPVVLDRTGLRRLRYPAVSLGVVFARLKRLRASEANSADVQGPFYAPLREAFAKAVASGHKEDMCDAWNLCREFKQEGKMLSTWDDCEDAGQNLPESGRKYTAHLKAVGFGA